MQLGISKSISKRKKERATEEWKKSGDNWFWLDDNGEMAVDQLIEDDDDYWYYADGDGELYASEIKTIKGKKYAFDNYGRMIDGLVFLGMKEKENNPGSFSSTDIESKYEDDNETTGRYDTEDDFDTFVIQHATEISDHQINAYYFGDSEAVL